MSDLENTSKVNESVQLARSVQRNMVRNLRVLIQPQVNDKGVKQAMFYVLWRATMPSVLVETSFISNRLEERRLQQFGLSEKDRKRYIAHGVESYFRSEMIARR